MLLEEGTVREHIRMNSLGPHVQFLLKLVRTALMCKFNINPRESSLFQVSAYRSGLRLSQQDLVGVSTVLMSVLAGGICSLCVSALESAGAVPEACLLLSNKGLAQLTGLLEGLITPGSSATVPCMFYRLIGNLLLLRGTVEGGGKLGSSNKMRHFFSLKLIGLLGEAVTRVF